MRPVKVDIIVTLKLKKFGRYISYISRSCDTILLHYECIYPSISESQKYILVSLLLLNPASLFTFEERFAKTAVIQTL